MRLIRHWPRADGTLNEHSVDLGPRPAPAPARPSYLHQSGGARALPDALPIVHLRPHEMRK